ncbi:MAG: hypothetical protein K6G29_02390 [Clostridiales bacterium]|nr:hypothetical protein [Clostridiales bacterium]
MTKNNRRITFPELCFLAVIAVAAAWGLQHYYKPAETAAKDTPALSAETASTQQIYAEIAWDEDTVRDALCRGIEAGDEKIAFPYDCSAVLFDLFHEVLADHPEYFWLTGSGSYARRTSQDGVTVVFTMDTLITPDEIVSRRAALEERVNDILTRAEAYATVYERLLFLHDLLVDDTDYDADTAAVMFEGDPTDTVSRATGAYGCLVDRLAVCSGYAAAYQLLCARLGVPCARVQGTESRTGAPHEWNIVELEGAWTHIDVTWDDPIFTGEPEEGYRSYDYFCVTTDEIARTHIFDHDAIPPCESDIYGYYKVNGLTLETYDPDAAASLIARQVGGCIRLKFPDADTLDAAEEDLIEKRRIFDIPAVRDTGVRSLRYSTSEMGTLSIWLLP